MPSTDLASALAAAVGPGSLVTDPDRLAALSRDYTGRFQGDPAVGVHPESTAAVAAVLELAAEHSTAVSILGGNTGLVGGGAPTDGAVLLHTAALADVEIDPAVREARAGAGVTLATLEEAAAPHGLRFAVDLASRGSATLGGMIATNAGGRQVLRFGSTRRHVLGVEAVLAGGAVVDRLESPPKDNTGYDLTGLFVGSEGTLGVVTRARLRLVPVPARQLVALVPLAGMTPAVELARRALPRTAVEALDFLTAETLAFVSTQMGLTPPRAAAAVYAIAEVAGYGAGEELDAEVAALLEGLADLDDVAIGDSAEAREELWRYRELAAEALEQGNSPVKVDTGLPLGSLARFVDDCPAVVRAVAPDATVLSFGHLGDGNVHVNVLGADAARREVERAVLELSVARGGSVSAEHGIGRAKVAYLPFTRRAGDLHAMAAVKAALDPLGILNPGVLFEANPRGV